MSKRTDAEILEEMRADFVIQAARQARKVAAAEEKRRRKSAKRVHARAVQYIHRRWGPLIASLAKGSGAQETVIAPALLIDGEVLTRPPPYRHHNLIWVWSDKHPGERLMATHPDFEQGFVTSTGRWLRRAPAAVLAFEAGQIEEPKRQLFSEDLW